MTRDYKLYISDILDCTKKVEEFVGAMTYRDFVKDDKTSTAVVRKLEIVGEATKQLPKEIKQRFEDIPWSDMAAKG